MKQSQADLYLETYQVLDLEMSRLREIQRWQTSASSKVWDVLYILYDPFLFFRNLARSGLSMLSKYVHVIFYAVSC